MSEKQDYIKRLLRSYPHSYQVSCLPTVKRNKCEAILERLQSERKRPYDTDEEHITSGNFITALHFRLGHEDAAFEINKELRGLYPTNITAKINYIYMSILTGSEYEAKVVLDEIEKQEKSPDWDFIFTTVEVEQAYFLSRTYPSHYQEAISIYERALKRFPHMFQWKFGSALSCRRCLRLQTFMFESNLETSDVWFYFRIAVGHVLDIVKTCGNSRLLAKSWVELGQLLLLIKKPSYPISRDGADQLSHLIPKIEAVDCFYNALRIDSAWEDEFVLERCGKFLHIVSENVSLNEWKDILTECYVLLKKAVALRPTVFSYQQLAIVLELCDNTEMDWQVLQCIEIEGFEQHFVYNCGDMETHSETFLNKPEQADTIFIPHPKEREDAIQTTRSLVNPNHYQWNHLNNSAPTVAKYSPRKDWKATTRPAFCYHTKDYMNLPTASGHAGQVEWTTVRYKTSKKKSPAYMPAVVNVPEDDKGITTSYIRRSLPEKNSIKSPRVVKRCKCDNSFLKEASSLLMKSIQLSKTCNTNAFYQLGLLFRKLGNYSSAIDCFKTILRGMNEAGNSLMDTVNAYEQVGFCLIDLSDDPQCSQTQKQRYRDESKLMMIRSIEQAAILVTRVPQMGPKDHESWQAFPTVKRLFEDEPKTFKGSQEMAQLCVLVGKHKDALDFYNELLRETPRGIPKEKVFVKIIQQYINLNDFPNAQACLRLLMCTSDGRSEIESRLVYQVYLGSIHHSITTSDPDYVTEDMKACYQSAFEHKHGRILSEYEQNWDVFILDDPEQTDEEATALQNWISETCGLTVTRNDEEVLGSKLAIPVQIDVMTKSKCLLIVLGKEIPNVLKSFLNLAVSLSYEEGGSRTIVPVCTSVRKLPPTLADRRSIYLSRDITSGRYRNEDLLECFMAMLELDFASFD